MPETNYVRLKDESGGGEARRGAVLIVVGRVLLWFDALLAIFVYTGVRGGSHLWTWWVIGEAVLGLGLILVGSRMRARGIARSAPRSKAA
jgi:hypothetical protein